MKREDVADLLLFIVSIDGREADRFMAQGWYEVLQSVDLTLSQAKEKVIAFHHAGKTRYIQPGDIIPVKKKITELDSYNMTHRDLFGERRKWQAEHPNGTAAEFSKWYESTGGSVVKFNDGYRR